MSYILDALKKAEAERTLGSVPNLTTQSVASISSDARPALWRKPGTWIVSAMLIGALGTFIWLTSWQQAAPAVVVATQLPGPPIPKPPEAATQPAPAQQPLPPAAPVAQTPAPAPVATPVPSKIKPPAPVPVKRKSEPKTAAKVEDDESPQPSTQPPLKPPLKPPLASEAPAAKKPPPAPAAAPATEKLPTLRELPENIQREIPQLAIGGYIYSRNPAERSILINNRLLREGEQAAPGLTLEKMMPREAVLSFKGYRYRVTY